MSLFGTSPTEDSPSMHSSFAQTRQSIFDDDGLFTRSNSNSLFDDGETKAAKPEQEDEPWGMPTPRKAHKNRSDLLQNLLPASDVPDTYVEVFDDVLGSQQEGHNGGRIGPTGLQNVLTASRISQDDQLKIMGIVSPGASGEAVTLGRNEFNCLLALIGLAQEGETLSLDSIDERRRSLPVPKFPSFRRGDDGARAFLQATNDLAAKPPQTPTKSSKKAALQPTSNPRQNSMEYSDDPWNTPDVHKNHKHAAKANGTESAPPRPALNGNGETGSTDAVVHGRTTSTFTTSDTSGREPADTGAGAGSFSESSAPGGDWTGGYGGGDDAGNPAANPFGGAGGAGNGDQGASRPPPATGRSLGSGRTGGAIEENLTVTLMPEKEGVFMFQHHNYEVSSSRRGSKVIRRYSDFVWLLDCLHKRYPFRILPLLPPKRVAVNGNHLSNDGGFIEKRRRGLVRFLNAMVRHPVIGQEQLVVMFLTVPTELSVWRKQAAVSVLDEFTDRPMPAGLEESLSPRLEELFDRTSSGVRRSTELYINLCNIVDRLVKRSEGIAADQARIASTLSALTEATADTYATDTNEVPLLIDGMQATGKHLATSETLMQDEAKAWDEGVLEDLKRQRDALVSVRDLFDRRERLDKDNIPTLERRIQSNETKLAGLRGKPEGLVKPGEIEKVVEAIIKDKESIVNQHNRSVFVKETLRDELVYFQSTQYHVTKWNQDWAQERAKYAELLADNWRRLIDELEGMPLGE